MAVYKMTQSFDNCGRGCCGSTNRQTLVVAATPREAFGFVLEAYHDEDSDDHSHKWKCFELDLNTPGLAKTLKDHTASLH